MADSVLPCKYFNTPTGCRNGANCSFAHAISMKPPCRFFGSEVGCRFGDSCMYSHDNESIINRGGPRGRPRGRGRGRGRFQSRGGMMPSSRIPEGQWHGDESDEENAPPAPKYKPDSGLNDMLSFGLKPTPEGWEEYAEMQRAFKVHDQDVEMQDVGGDESNMEMFQPQMEFDGQGAYTPKGRGRGTLYADTLANGNPYFRGRGGRGRGKF